MARNRTAPSAPQAIVGVFAAIGLLVLATMVALDRFQSTPSSSSAGATGLAVEAPAAGDAAGQGAATPADPAATTVPADGVAGQELDETSEDSTPCLMEHGALRPGASGPDVLCLQEALKATGALAADPTGTYDGPTEAAVRRVQEQRNLFVDGVAGRETGKALGIWPAEESKVVRTPAPAADAKDLMGYPLSSVASAGDAAPQLPASSGAGRRLVYDRAGQRVWAVAKDGAIIRSWLVSGSMYGNEQPGTHKVYSRSPVSTAWNGKAYLPKMVRWLKTQRGALGFHAIPIKVSDRSVYQSEAELGTRLSGGCQRQANLDAAFLWDFAQVGTPVVVV
jgi:peptidoglycan hydrolase-like protein with peptidoglycan-binding domain